MKSAHLSSIRAAALAAVLLLGLGVNLPAATLNVPGDHATIQAAIDAAGAGDTVQVAAGTYAEEILLNKEVTLQGANAGIPAGANPGSRVAESIIDGGFIVSAAATIDGVTIRNGRASGSLHVGVAVAASGVSVINCIITDVLAPAQSDGLSTQPGNDNLTLTNSTIQNNWRGLYLNPGSGNVISGNLIDANNGVGVGIGSDSQSNLTLSGNIISNHTLEGWGASAVGTNVSATENSFLNNLVSIAHYGGEAINANLNYWGDLEPDFLNLTVGNVDTTFWYTDSGLSIVASSLPVKNITQNSFHSTIQAAITAASAGDVINVAAGTYTESISLNQSVTLLGANAGVHPTVGNHPTATVGTRGPETILSYGNGPGAITVSADDVTLDGLKITSTGTRTIDTYADADRFTMRNCIWENTSGYAQQGTMQFGGGSHVDCLFEFNLFDNGETALLYTGGDFDGLVLQYNLLNCEGDAAFWTAGPLDNGVIRGNEFDGTIDGVPGVGFNTVNIGQAGNLLIEDNYIHDNQYTTLQVGMIGGQVLNNTFENTFPYSSDPVLYGGYDIYFWGGAWGTALSANNLISGNSFSYNSSVDGPVRAIRLAGPASAGDPAIDASTFTIENNSFLDGGAFAGTAAIRHQGDQGTAIDASLNYWGTATPELGDLIDGNGVINSYYADAALTDLRSSEVWVDDDFSVATPGWGVTHFATIQNAQTQVISGGTVNVAAGSYDEIGQIVIDKDLTIVGAGIGVTTLQPTANTGSSGDSRGWWLVESGVSLSLSDLTLDGTGFDIYQALRVKGGGTFERVAFKEIKFPGYAGMAIAAFGDLNLDVADSTFEECGRIGVLYFGTGIAGSSFTGNTYTGKGSGDWLDYALDVSAGATVLIDGNTITGCTGVASSDGSVSSGILVTTFFAGGTTATITNNTIHACTSGVNVGYNGSDTSSVTIEDNDLSGNDFGVVGTIPFDASPNYWGAADGPSGVGPGTGAAVDSDVAYSPWWADAAMTTLAYDSGSFDSDYTVGPGEVLEIPETLTIGGGTFLVDQGTLIAGSLDLAEGSVLDVVNGELVINGSTIAGSFTFFNSFGSVNFNDDVSITGSAEGLILISDVHVATGATITVDGTLVIDGSTVDSAGRFNLVVAETGDFTMARTVMVNGDMVVNSGAVKVYDNRFETSTIDVTALATGAAIYHNITDDLGWLTDSGTDTVTIVDAWGNLTDPTATENNLLLDLDISALDADRTQDTDGNVYIQPEDVIMGTIDVSALQAKISGVEMLLGYSTDYLTAASLGAGTNWDPPVLVNTDISTVIGKIDAALGLSFSFVDPDGTDADQLVADVELTAGSLEGETVFFQRVKLASDAFGGDTRLTVGGVTPSYLTPFTANSGTITIDGTAPVIDVDSATIEQDAADMTVSGVITIQGMVDIAAAAFDALAGIDDVDVVVQLVGPTTYPAVLGGTNPVTIGTDDYTEYAFSYEVVPATLNGEYNVVMTVTDRSGNQTIETLGAIVINKNQVSVDIELEGLVAGPLSRDVVFVFTDVLGSVIETRTVAVEFQDGSGTAVFADVDDGAVSLSAKTAWNLRQRLAIGLDGDGQAEDLSFLLPGGDLNDDNAANMLDYSILRYYWLELDPDADIDGSGGVDLPDFQILQSNFYTTGDPE